jgi:hypothetical protein
MVNQVLDSLAPSRGECLHRSALFQERLQDQQRGKQTVIPEGTAQPRLGIRLWLQRGGHQQPSFTLGLSRK